MARTAEPETDGPAEAAADWLVTVPVSQEAGRIGVQLPETSLGSFHHAAKRDKPFLHPRRPSSGTVISQGHPVDPQPGEEQDQRWYLGIWHGDVNGHNSWRKTGRDKTGRIIRVQVPTL